MKHLVGFQSAAAALIVVLGFGCASTDQSLPPAKVAPPAASPAEVEQALPGTWVIDVETSADALARVRFKSRQVTMLRREGNQPATHESAVVAERFDKKEFREALSFWLDTLRKPDMRWRVIFKPDGTGEHWAVIETGHPAVSTPFSWKLDGWRLSVQYAAGAKFQNFEVEMPSALELNYPMQPLGDHLVLRHSR